MFLFMNRIRPLGSPEELRAMSVSRQELYLTSIVHAINWFRAVVNVYQDQVHLCAPFSP